MFALLLLSLHAPIGVVRLPRHFRLRALQFGGATRGALLVGTRPKGGGGGGALRTPKLSQRTMCFIGARGAADFVLGIPRGNFSCATLCVYTQNTQNFVEN